MAQPRLNPAPVDVEYVDVPPQPQGDFRINALRDEINDLKRRNRDLEAVCSAVRQQLAPLYRSLQMLFNEMDIIEVTHSAPVGSSKHPAWDMWKQRLGGSVSKVIDALLITSNLSNGQLAIATGLDRGTITQCIYRMNKAGLINKNGGKFSLKDLS